MISTVTMATDYEMLRQYLGGVRFMALAENYLASLRAQVNCTARFCRLSEYASASPDCAPEIAELAALEQAQREAFEAPDVATLVEADLAAQGFASPDAWEIHFHPGLRLLRFHHNSTSIWSALRCGEVPPCPMALDTPQDIMVWRQKNQPRMRMLSDDEYAAIRAIREGMSYGEMSAMLSRRNPAEPAATRAETYLRGWLEAEVLTEVNRTPAEK